MKSLLLALLLIGCGTYALRTATIADPTHNEGGNQLLGFDEDDLSSMFDDRLDPISTKLDGIDTRLQNLEESLIERLTKMSDCTFRTAEFIESQRAQATAKPATSSNGSTGGGSSGSFTSSLYNGQKKPSSQTSGGSSGNPSAVVYSTQTATPTITYSAATQAPTVVSASHWTYPGDISTHLQTTHGQSVAGLSTEQQLQLHDSIHESTRPGFGIARSVTRASSQTGYCPGGVCPRPGVQTTRTSAFTLSRPKLFRR